MFKKLLMKAAAAVPKVAKAAKKAVKLAKKAKNKVKKKLKKKLGKIFTKARKLARKLSKKVIKKFKQAAKKVVLAAKNVAKQAKAISKEAVAQVKWALKNPDQFKQSVSQAYESIKHMELSNITDDMTWGEKGKTALSNFGILAAQYVQGTIEGRTDSFKSLLEDGKAAIDSFKYYTDPKEGANRRAELVQSIKYTITHPKETIQNRISSYKETFNNFKETLSNGNVYDWAYQINKTTTDIALEALGSKGSRLVVKESYKSFNHVIESQQGKNKLPSSQKKDGSGDNKGNIASTDNFVGKLYGKDVVLPNVKTQQVTFTKRDPAETKQLRRQFENVRKDLMKSMANIPEKVKELKQAGISAEDIKDMRKYGDVPDGWQVHHKIPLDQGGINDVENLVLIKHHPYHKVITNEQKRLTKGMNPGDSREVEFPIPDGDIYPPKPYED